MKEIPVDEDNLNCIDMLQDIETTHEDELNRSLATEIINLVALTQDKHEVHKDYKLQRGDYILYSIIF